MDITIVYSEPTQRAKHTLYALTDEDTKHSVHIVSQALKRLRHTVNILPITENSIQSIYSIRSDCIFNLIEWTGLDLPLAIKSFEALESIHIPFTGTQRYGYEISTNKIFMKQTFDSFFIPTPEWQIFTNANDQIKKTFRYPVILKPAFEHCSIGVSTDGIATNVRQLRFRLKEKIAQFKQPFIVEEYIHGEEVHVTLLEEKDSIRVLPLSRIVFNTTVKRPILTFHGRWVPGHPEFSSSSIGPARLPDVVRSLVSHICIQTFSVFQLSGYARVDLRMKGGIPYILEINSNPGLDNDPEYEMMYSCNLAGFPFVKLIDAIIRSAFIRNIHLR